MKKDNSLFLLFWGSIDAISNYMDEIDLLRRDHDDPYLIFASRHPDGLATVQLYWTKTNKAKALEWLESQHEKIKDETIRNSIAWRYAEGSNLGKPDTRIRVNGHYMIGWGEGHTSGRVYKNARQFLEYAVGATTEKNVAACLADLAKFNNLNLMEFLHKYE